MEVLLTKRNGEVKMEQTFDYLCSLLRNGEYVVKITRKVEPRTVSQNSLLWMWYKCIEDNTGTLKDDVHEYYKQKFLSRRVFVGRREVVIPGSTANLNTVQFSRYLELVKADAAAEFGIALPLPEDQYYRQFVSHYKNR